MVDKDVPAAWLDLLLIGCGGRPSHTIEQVEQYLVVTSANAKKRWMQRRKTGIKRYFRFYKMIKRNCSVPSRSRYAMFAAAAGSHGLQWLKTMSVRHFYAQQAAGQRTTRPAWHIGTTTGNRKAGQGGMVGWGSLLSLEPVSAELLPLFLTLVWWLLLFGRNSLRCSTVDEDAQKG